MGKYDHKISPKINRSGEVILLKTGSSFQLIKGGITNQGSYYKSVQNN